MRLTLLLDLDDTLLDSNMGEFLPAYYEQLAKHLSPLVPPESMLSALRSGVKRMLANQDPSRTLREVFEADFYSRLGVEPDDLRPAIMRFYESVFPTLGARTRPRAGARELVDWALGAGHQVAIATDPLFPLQATEERVRWAGLDPSRFDLISSFESFHFSKSNPAYFAEVIGRLGWPDRAVLMAGNDVDRDLAPAQQIGLMTYHVNGSQRHAADRAGQDPSEASTRPNGDLIELRAWLESTELEPFVPAFESRQAILAVLESTPGVLQSLTAGLTPAMWADEPSPSEWALIELVCHLRDTEREVHKLQIETLLEAATPFVPRPDAAVWAKQRRYLREDGPTAIREFALARIAMLGLLRSAPDDVWTKTARHAIFGPTNFKEVIGFMADHDRMHVQQAWSTLRTLSA